MHTYDSTQTRNLLGYTAIVDEIEAILHLKKSGAAFAPERIIMNWGMKDSLLVMPAYDDTWLVNKLVTVHPENPAANLPMIQGEVILIRRSNGERILRLDGSTVTAMRTAAVSMVAIKRMGYGSAATFTVCGSGVQALSHSEAIMELFPESRVLLVARNDRAANQLAEKIWERGGKLILQKDLQLAIAQSEVVLTTTSSRAPFIDNQVVTQNRDTSLLFVAVGAYRADMAELAPELVKRVEGVIGVDTVYGASHEAGDLIQANVDKSRMQPIESLSADQLSGNIHLFKSVGNALWDLAAARAAAKAVSRADA